MSFNLIAFLIHVLLFLLGGYIYLFATGIVNIRNNKVAEEFRNENKRLLSWLGMGLAAIMLVNAFFDLADLLK
jgi:cell division protein FtsW (lipid II flippase)